MSNIKSTYDPIKKLWQGRRTPNKFGPDYSVGRAVLEALQKDPEHIAQICYHNGKKYTSGEIATLSIRVAQHFEELGLPQCTVIGICAANSDYIAPLFYGAMLAGLTVSTLDPSFEKDGIRHTFSITKPKLVFCDGLIYTKVSEALKEGLLDCKVYTTQQHIAGVPEITEFLAETGREPNYKPPSLQHGYDQTAVIVCSSGTTGLPKGVCISHANLLHSVFVEQNKEDTMVCFSTLYWGTGVTFLVFPTLNGTTRVITAKGFNPEAFFDIIEKYKVTIVFTPPALIALALTSNKIKDSNLTSVRAYLTGGCAVPRSVVRAMQTYMPNALFMGAYGMSEVGGVICFGELDDKGSNGQLVDNEEMKVINSEGEHLDPGEIGEMCIRIPFKWAGYYENPKATAEFRDNEGWLHSGDLGYISSEGNVYVIDRIKEILKYNGFHFYPTEIERVISELPGVSEVCVCGLPDEVSVFLPTAAIVRSSGSDLTESMVMEHVAMKMDHFKQLHGGVYFVDSLPKTASGKYLRRNVVEICQKLKNHNSQNI